MTLLTDRDREQIREEARRDYPADPMMQDIRYVRLLRSRELGDLSLEKRLGLWVDPEFERMATVSRRVAVDGRASR